MNRDRRDFERVTILGHLPGEMMVFQPMAVREISVGGATVETTYPLHLDSLHDLRLTLGGLALVLKGRVVHSSIADMDPQAVIYRTGLEFVGCSERVKKALADYIVQLKSERSGA
jgi:hypothetical protein